MRGVVEARAFPAWVAFCTAVTVAVASGIVVDDSVPARVAAGLAGLVVGVVLAFATAAAVVVRPARKPAPAGAPEPAEAPTVVVADERRARLEAQLASAGPHADVDAWIASTRTLLDETVPSASGYFASLGSRSFPDEQARLDAHRARLETILRDFL